MKIIRSWLIGAYRQHCEANHRSAGRGCTPSRLKPLVINRINWIFIQTCTRLQQRSAKDAHIVEAGEARIHNEWMMFNVIDVFVYLGRTCIVGLEFVFASSVWMWLCSREEVRLGILGWRPTMGPTEHLLTSLIVTSPFSTGIVKSQIFGESSARPLTRGVLVTKTALVRILNWTQIQYGPKFKSWHFRNRNTTMLMHWKPNLQSSGCW